MAKIRDYGNEETEKLLKQLEKRLTAEYSDAVRDVEAKFKDYMRRFEIKDEIKRKAVDAGVLEQKDYIKWRTSQVMVGERWQAMLDQLSADLHTTNEKAISIARGYQYDAYAINHNFATYTIESQSQINTSYTLYDRQTVERLVREYPELLPPPKPGGKTARKLAENKDLRWNRQKISSAVMQGVIQGESVPQMARRLESVGEMDHRAAIRNARTMVTGAQNAGRINAGKRARDMGIGTTNVWMATLDMRTRHEHRVLDGQRREVDEPFEVEGEKIMYPGDPKAAAHLVYNCRCTLIPQVKGFEYDIRDDANMDYSGIEGMTYDEWKKDRREKPNPITLPEEKAEAIKQSYNAEYRKLRKDTAEAKGEKYNGSYSPSGQSNSGIGGSSFSDGYTDEQQKEIQQLLDSAPQEVRDVFNKFGSKLSPVDENVDKTIGPAYFHTKDQKVHMHRANAVAGNVFETPYQQHFHEYAHNIDWLAGNKSFFSKKYRNADGKTLEDVIQKDWNDALFGYFKTNAKEKGSIYRQAFEAQITDGGMGAINYVGSLLSNWRQIEGIGRFDPAYASLYDELWSLQTDKQVRTYFIKHLDIFADQVYNDNKTSVVQDFTQMMCTTYTQRERAMVSDLFGRMSAQHGGDSKPFGFGHEPNYIKGIGNLTTEAFADFTGATLANPDSLRLIQKYLPNAYGMYIDMLKGMI